MVENCFSSGVATAEAMVSGEAPGQARAHRDDGVVHVGQVAHRQLRVADDAEEQDADHHQRGGDRPPDEELGEVHGRLFGLDVSRTTRRAPGEMRNCPSVTTISPGSRPFEITALTSSERSTTTGFAVAEESAFST